MHRKNIGMIAIALCFLLSAFSVHATTVNNLDFNMSILRNGVYCENQLQAGKSLQIDTDIKNMATSTQNVALFIAVYDINNKLINVYQDKNEALTGMQNDTLSVTTEAISQNIQYAKVFLWNGAILQPFLFEPITLNYNEQDYFANSIEAANSIKIDHSFEGKINTSSDVDFIKFTPTQTGTYLINSKTMGTSNIELFGPDRSSIAVGNSIGDTTNYIKYKLIAGQEYYLKTSGSSGASYSDSISQMPQILVSVSKNKITVDSNITNGAATASVKLLNTNGTIIAQTGANVVNNHINCSLELSSIEPQYRLAILTEDDLYAIYDIAIQNNPIVYNVQPNTYVSVPVNVSNIYDLSNIYSSIAFENSDFVVTDVCENTLTAETGVGLITTSQVNILDVNNSYVVFKSTRSLTESWSGIINIVKLNSVGNGEKTVNIYVYKIW